MGRPKFRDYGIRQKGSVEYAFDPIILMQLVEQRAIEMAAAHHSRHERAIEVYNFIIKKALKILPPKQRKIFFSLWVRSGGSKKKGIMDYSRRIGQSPYSNYNSETKSTISLIKWLKKTGYYDVLLRYLHGDES